MEYRVNGRVLQYESIGPAAWGEGRILLRDGTDLTLNTPWQKAGLAIESLYANGDDFEKFSIASRELVRNCWRAAGLDIPDQFDLTKYHLIASDLPTHLRAVEKTKLLSVSDFPLGIRMIEERISEICKTPLVARNPFDGQAIFHFRVIRPQQQDNNPLHRDVWLEDYDSCINLYLPVAGSNELSSLILIKGSHLWPENKIKKTVSGAVINGLKFNVPAVTEIQGPYEIVRPVPIDNEVLVFSPYLIHGGAVNLSTDTTRTSIELRLWKK